MKGSVITSIVLHGLVLVLLLVTFTPTPMEVTAGEALPVELVPIEEMAQLQEGDKEAPKKAESSKEITKNEQTVEDALNSGNNDFDLKSVPVPDEKPSNVQKSAAAKQSDVVAPQDVAEQKSDDKVAEDTAIEPDTQVAAREEPAVEVKPEPKPEVKPVEKPAEQEEAKEEPVPENVPIPEVRPKVEPKKVEEKKDEPKKVEEKKEIKVAEAKTEKNKNARKDKENKKAAKSTTSKDSDFNSNEIAELLNKVDNQAGGAKRSKRDKAFGADRSTGGQKLSQSEMDALRGLIEKNWSIMPGQVTDNEIVITVKFELDENGMLVGTPEVKGTGGEDGSRGALERGAVRAVMKSQPFDTLPKDKYDTWKVVTVNFHPSDMM